MSYRSTARKGRLLTQQPTLLIVEPDAAIAALFAQALSEEGYTVVCAATPHEAIAQCMARGPAAFTVVLSNPLAPRGAAYTWLDRLRAWTHGAIVICTRYPAAYYADHQARGYAAVLEEPCELDEMLDLVTALCRGASEDVG